MGIRTYRNANGKWEIPPNLDTTNFDFGWRPEPYDPPFIHQFGTQWQKTGGPRYIVEGATQIKWVDDQHAIALEYPNRCWRGASDITFDYSWHPDETDPPMIYQFGTQWQKTGGPRYVVPGATQVKYVDYPKAIKHTPQDMSVWSNTKNMDFDWTWHPDDTEPPYIYQFPTQWYHDDGPRYTVPGATQLKYMTDPRAKRLPCMDRWILNHTVRPDSMDWSWVPPPQHPPYLWAWGNQWRTAEETPTVVYADPGASEYKYMNDRRAHMLLPPLDIVFVSNGETGEEERYARLCEVAPRKPQWVRGINGRERALKRAAEIASTPWVIVFPGKLWADQYFPWDFQSNPWHNPKHYIFYAQNNVNGLCYGHQAAVAYHRETLLNTGGWGLDITMSAPHDIVPHLSGIAQYDCDPLVTWRTAFREAIKLKCAAIDGDSESAYRLECWTTVGNGPLGEWSILGAVDGVNYWEEVGGDSGSLMLSFDWDWLKSRWDKCGYSKDT